MKKRKPATKKAKVSGKASAKSPVKRAATTKGKASPKPPKRPRTKRAKAPPARTERPTTHVRKTTPANATKGSPPRHHDADAEPFAVTASDIEGLDSLQFRRFIRDLLSNEIDAYGGSPSDLVDSPGDGSDQGQDFATKRCKPIAGASDDFIPIGETVWQIKAEKKTPTDAELKKEIRKPRPRAVLEAGGSYRFLAQQPGTGEDQVDEKLKKLAVADGHKEHQVAFFARGGLTRRARRFPSLARQMFFNRPIDKVHPYEWWNEQHQSPPFDAKARGAELATLQGFFANPQRPAHLRVLGPAGVGKTRLVLEALSRAGLGPMVVYAENPGTGQFSSLFDWITTNKVRAVVVVDECSEADAQRLRNRAIDHTVPIIFVSIGRVEDGGLRSSPPDLRLSVQRMSEADVVRILKSVATLDDPVLVQVARATGGFVKLAKVVAQGIAANPHLAPEPGNTITLDIVDDVLKQLPGLSDKAYEWLGLVALFKEVRSESTDAGSELAILASFAGADATELSSWIMAATTAEVLSDKGERIFVTPSLLAVHLARQTIRRRKRDLKKWLLGLPQRLQEACVAQMVQLRSTDEGKQLAEELLAGDDPFGNLLSVRQTWADNVFLALGSIAKNESLRQLHGMFDRDPDAASRVAASDSLAHLLFRLLWRPEHFQAAFRLVLRGLDKLGSAEGGRLQRLVTASLQVAVAISRLPFLERLGIVREEFENGGHAQFVRGLIVSGIASGVGASGGEGYTDLDVDVDEESRDHWMPKTVAEAQDCARAGASFVVRALKDAEITVRAAAAAGLIDHAASMIREGAHAEVLGALPAALEIDRRVGKVREELDRVLAFDRVSDTAADSVRKAIAALPQDLESRIRVLVESWPLVDNREERGLDPRPDPKQVAREMIESATRRSLIGQLFEPWAENTYDLFNALAHSSEATAIWPEILEAGRATDKTWGPSVFLAIAHDAGSGALVGVPTALLKSDHLFDRIVGAETLTKAEATAEELRLLATAVRDGRVPARALRYGVFGRWAERRDASALAELIHAASIAEGDKGVAIALAHAAQKNLTLSFAEQADLLVATMLDVQGHDAWTWEQLAKGVSQHEPERFARSIVVRLKEWRSGKTQSPYERWADTAAAHALEMCVVKVPTLAPEVLGLWDAMPYFVEHKLFATIAGRLDVQTLVDWATDERRQIALAQIARPQNDQQTDELLTRIGTTSRFAVSLRRALVPRSWSGSLARILEQRAGAVAEWAVDPARTDGFRRWASESARWLQDVAEETKKSEDIE